MRIGYLDGSRLRRGLIAGCDYVQQQRAELNRINVFPVPDGDTGTNLALTAAAIADRLRGSSSESVGIVAREAANAAIMGARGNCGMILSHFLLGLANHIGNRERIETAELADALRAAVDHVYRSLESPVEGTIITVMREIAEEAQQRSIDDFAELIDHLVARGQAAVACTPELLPALARAGVVDAGAKGFVGIIEGIEARLKGAPIKVPVAAAAEPEAPPAAVAEFPGESEKYRYCTEALVEGTALPDADVIRAVLREFGDSLIVIRSNGVLKVHVHTDEPARVFGYLRGVGKLLTHKAEDMRAQHEAIERAAAAHVRLARRPVALVTDSACDLPDIAARAHGIRVVPMSLVFPDRVLRDGVDITADEFVEHMHAGDRATTSQPPPAAFLEAFKGAAEDGEAVLAVIISAALSGTFASAEAAARNIEDARITLFDSRAASISQGFLVLKAAELAELGWSPDDIVRELDRVRSQSGIFFTVDVFDNLLASGRVSRGKVMIAGLLDIKPILEIDNSGKVAPLAKVRGRNNVLKRMLDILQQRVPRDAQAVRFGVVHVGAPEVAQSVADEIERLWPGRDIFTVPATPVLSTHLGPGAWGVAWQWED